MTEYTITQITNNELEDIELSISGDNIVWTANDGDGEEVFLYDGNSTTQLTDNDLFDSTPQISGDNIVWWRSANPSTNIFGVGELVLYDGTTTSVIAEVSGYPFPAISGNNVAWGGFSLTGSSVFLYDVTTGTINALSNSAFWISTDSNAISGNNVVWTGDFFDPSVAGEVFLYDGTTTTQITDGDLTATLPLISGDNIAWSAGTADVNATDSGLSSNEIFLYDGTTTTQITDNDVVDILLAIDGNNLLFSSGAENLSDLFFYNGSETVQLTDGDSATENFGGSISGNKVVWTESDGNDLEIFLYDGNTTTQITDNDTDDTAPSIDGDNIVWQGNDGIDTEIFLATANNSQTGGGDTGNNSGTTVYRFFNNDTGVHFYTANPAERDAVEDLANYTSEGASYQGVDPLTGNPEPQAVYRFLNQDTGVHLYTVSETERDAVEDLANYTFEGEAFFAYETEIDGLIPIYRFYNPTTGAHFYTPSEGERNNVEDNLTDFESEGIAYYALPIDTATL